MNLINVSSIQTSKVGLREIVLIILASMAIVAGASITPDLPYIHRAFIDIENSELDGIVIAACSPRIKTKEFSFDSDLLVERVNLREQVVWCQEPNNEDTQMMAEDYLRMGITKAEKTLNPKPYIPDDLSSDILVIGGGISGITSAVEGAKAGYKVISVE